MVRLHIHDLSIAYGSNMVLKGVTLHPRPGSVLGIIGPNGTGKTTLFKGILGLLRPKRGEILIDERNVLDFDRTTLTEYVGYLPQDTSGSGNFTVFEAILLGRLPYLNWFIDKEDITKVKRIIRTFGLKGYASKNIQDLSGGERQKVFIAQVLVREPKILILDEPTSSLDIKHKYEMCALIQELTKKYGITTLIAIHDLNLAARFSNQLVLLKDGVVHIEGDSSSVLTAATLKEVYGIKAKIIEDEGVPQIIPHGSCNKSEIKGRRPIQDQ